ncbi:MAG: Rare lipoprotein [Conexibacter sp.]|nr:Rare lipoprotein [Conexibacter sp.]
MRQHSQRRARPRHAAVGALALGSIGTVLSATALAPAQADSAATPPSSPTISLRNPHLHYGEWLVVQGRLPRTEAGQRMSLQYARRGRGWRAVKATTVARDGSYRASASLHASGTVRMVRTASAVAAAVRSASETRRVAVAAELVVARRSRATQVGHAIRVAGTVLPRGGGRHVVVETGARGHWRAVARARTQANGHFSARVEARRLGTIALRVRFVADRKNAESHAVAGSLKVGRPFRPSLASWYGDYGGPLACGGSLGAGQLGVANKSLPCGTQVTIRYRGREVTVPVIDRGPYVGGREWDLTGATAQALGFDGVGTVYVDR